jgi:hypothetical protein
MATGLDVLNVARTQIGFVEGPNNESPYGTWFGIPNQPYCAMGVSWCFAKVGLSHIIAAQGPKGFASCQVGLSWFQRQGRVVNKYQGQPGDIVFFSFNGSGTADHVELLEAASAGGITTIGFNTSPDHSNGSQTNGGGCYRRHRPYLNVLAIVRPAYPAIVKPTIAPSKTKKATAVVGGTGAAVAGATGMLHTTPGTTAGANPTPTPSPTVWAAPPFPVDKTSFIMGAKNDAVLAVELALAKAGLLPQQYVDAIMSAETVKALAKYEAKNPALKTKNGAINQTVYDALKATI